MTTVGDLLDEPSLRLTLAAGRAGLPNTVVAAHVSELTRPGPWLQGGELLMTVGLFLPDDVSGCRDYVSDLIQAGVSGLVLGLGAELPFQDGPAVLVAAAGERGLPLLLLPDPIPFIAVTKWVFARLADAERQEWRDAVEITRDLTAAATKPDPLTAVLSAWAAALDTSAVVTDLRGDVVAQAGPRAVELGGPDHPVPDGPHSPVAPATPVNGDARQVIDLGAAAPRGRLVLERSLDPRARHALAVLVSLLSLELDHRHAAGNPERERRAQVVAQLLSPSLRPELATRLATSVGLPPGPLRVVVVRTVGPERAEELAATLTSAVHQAVARPRASTVELLVPDVDHLVPTLQRVVAGHAIGISSLSRLADLAVNARQADSLSQVSAQLGQAVQAEESGATQLLLQLGSPDVLSAYSDALLAPLDRVDSRERGELLHSLEEWLRANGVWEAAAANLSVHRNTVRNRMARVAGLLGRSLDDADQRMELWLALKARSAVLQSRSAGPDRLPAPPSAPGPLG